MKWVRYNSWKLAHYVVLKIHLYLACFWLSEIFGFQISNSARIKGYCLVLTAPSELIVAANIWGLPLSIRGKRFWFMRVIFVHDEAHYRRILEFLKLLQKESDWAFTTTHMLYTEITTANVLSIAYSNWSFIMDFLKELDFRLYNGFLVITKVVALDLNLIYAVKIHGIFIINLFIQPIKKKLFNSIKIKFFHCIKVLTTCTFGSGV